MLKTMLERRVGSLNNIELFEILEIAEDDIKFNRISFKKYTNLKEVLDIVERCTTVLKRCA